MLCSSVINLQSKITSVAARLAQLALNVAGNHFDREQVADRADLGVLLKVAQVGERHFAAELGEPLGGDPAVLHKLGITLED